MSQDPPHLLRITRRFAASPERVFDAFLDPAIARQWLFTSPETDIAARRVEIDARVGGKWLMTNPCERYRGPAALGRPGVIAETSPAFSKRRFQ